MRSGAPPLAVLNVVYKMVTP